MKSDEKKVMFRVCGETRRCWRDVALVLVVCVNLCLFIAGFVYLAVLHGEVAALQMQLGRCIHETKEDGTYTGKMHVTEVSVNVVI